MGDDLFQGKVGYRSGGIFYSLFLAPKVKYCLTIDKYGITQEFKTLERIVDSKRLLDWSHCFKMIEGKKLSTMLPKIWKKRLIVAISDHRK